MANKHEIWELQSMQVAPLNAKIAMTKQRIRDWIDHYGIDGVYVSFSGGKDSTVLLTIAREMYPNIKAVFCDTGLEYPEIRQFVKTWDNVEWVKPKMNLVGVINKYGYPFISKEVSECVSGARKYLTSVIEAEMLNRPTDRHQSLPISGGIADIVDCVDKVSMQNPSGGGTTESTANSGESENSISVRMGQTHRVEWIWEAIQQATNTGIGGVEQSETSQTSQVSEPISQESLTRLSTEDLVKKAIQMNDGKKCGGQRSVEIWSTHWNPHF